MKAPLILCGALGRMGQEITELLKKSSLFSLHSVVIKSLTEQKLCDVQAFDDLSQALQHAKNEHIAPVVIDFSLAEQGAYNVMAATEYGCPFLLGTTGHGLKTLSALNHAKSHIPIVVAPNTSVMAALLTHFCSLATKSLPDCDASILDIHHKMKKDAPSGTAKAIADAMYEASAQKRKPAVHSMREGSVVGDHMVYFFNDFERLELIHRVSDRQVFAQGALVAAQFLFNRAPGLYEMKDVIKLNLTIENQS